LFEFYTLIAQQNKASHHCIALSGDVRLAKLTLHAGGINGNLTHTGALTINPPDLKFMPSRWLTDAPR
jgi:hypothetical protein